MTVTSWLTGMSEITNLNSLIKVDSDGGVLCPNLDDIHALLQSRFRVDLPFTKLGSSTLISVNPLKQLQSYNAQSQIEYKQNTYLPSHSILQPHAYDLASRVLLSLKRKGVSQAVIYEWVVVFGCWLLRILTPLQVVSLLLVNHTTNRS